MGIVNFGNFFTQIFRINSTKKINKKQNKNYFHSGNIIHGVFERGIVVNLYNGDVSSWPIQLGTLSLALTVGKKHTNKCLFPSTYKPQKCLTLYTYLECIANIWLSVSHNNF